MTLISKRHSASTDRTRRASTLELSSAQRFTTVLYQLRLQREQQLRRDRTASYFTLSSLTPSLKTLHTLTRHFITSGSVHFMRPQHAFRASAPCTVRHRPHGPSTFNAQYLPFLSNLTLMLFVAHHSQLNPIACSSNVFLVQCVSRSREEEKKCRVLVRDRAMP